MAARSEDIAHHPNDPIEDIGGGVIPDAGDVTTLGLLSDEDAIPSLPTGLPSEAQLRLFHGGTDELSTHEDTMTMLTARLEEQEALLARIPHEAIERRRHMEAIVRTQREIIKAVVIIHSLPPEQQVEVINDLSEELLDTDSEAQANLHEIRKAREALDDDTARELSDKQRDILQRIKRDLATMTDVALDDEMSQDEKYRPLIIQRIIEIAGQEGEVLTYDMLLERLGFIAVGKDGRKFTFPEGLFPPHIVEKWKSYSEAVDAHATASSRHERGVTDESLVIGADLTRRNGHNSLARSIQNYLRLEGWDFQKYREFVTKMLEEKEPTKQTKESQLTSEAILRFARHNDATGIIRRLGELGLTKD